MESQLINVEEMMELENHHLATIIIIDLGKKHQWMLKPIGKSLRSIQILYNLNVYPSYTY